MHLPPQQLSQMPLPPQQLNQMPLPPQQLSQMPLPQLSQMHPTPQFSQMALAQPSQKANGGWGNSIAIHSTGIRCRASAVHWFELRHVSSPAP
eukprot:2740259-Alexandrium_andersonii.AAC.1